jgi:transposase InsO family protein
MAYLTNEWRLNMPWEVVNLMDQKAQFISLAKARIKPVKTLCIDFSISRQTGYKWLKRVNNSTDMFDALTDRSRKPKYSPNRTSTTLENIFIALRKKYSYWGAKKLIVLAKERNPNIDMPSIRTINRIFKRNDLLTDASPDGKAYDKNFEYANPNDLWQMDYKGEFRYGDRRKYCYPLDILDDHSRFNILLDAHQRISFVNVQNSLMKAFKEYGLPEKMLMDHGTIWYAAHGRIHWTRLSVWLMQLDIDLIYSGIRHPQTQGKIERFHRTLKNDCIKRKIFASLKDIQKTFNHFRCEYNDIRPHESLDMQRPSQRYSASLRKFPKRIKSPEYPENSIIARLSSSGHLYFKGKYRFISEALANQYVMIRHYDDSLDVFFYKTLVKHINLKKGAPDVSTMSWHNM